MTSSTFRAAVRPWHARSTAFGLLAGLLLAACLRAAPPQANDTSETPPPAPPTPRVRLPVPPADASPEALRNYITRIGDPSLAPSSTGRRRYHRRKVANLTVEAAAAILAQVPADDPRHMEATLVTLGALEELARLDDPQAAERLTAFATPLADSDDPALAERAKQAMTSLAGRHGLLALRGHPLDLDGMLLDGRPFDPQSLTGKVVLVDFWATWCGPCVAEIPRVREAYDRYHERGFEVLGISLDHDPEALTAFVTDRAIPWPIIVDEREEDDGRTSLASRYGITAIPTMILVGRDGNVVSVEARGAELDDLLAELLPDRPTPSP